VTGTALEPASCWRHSGPCARGRFYSWRSGGPRPGPALPFQLALSDRLLLGRVLRGLAGVLRSLTGGSSGVASSGSGIASNGSGVASGGGGGVDSSASGVGRGGAGSGSGVGSGVASNGSGVSGGRGGIRRLRGGVNSGFNRSFLLGAAGERKGGQGGGECDLRVHVKYPMGSVMDETLTQRSPETWP
jgi:hypothetical protein